MDYAKQLVEGTSIRKSAAALGIHPNTAFRWRHRFLTLPNGQQAISLAGIAEADETYFLESLSLTGIMEPPMIGVMEPV